MSALIQISFSFFMYLLLSTYFYVNIRAIGEGGVGLGILIISIVLGVLLFIMQIFSNQTIYIKKSFLLLILFFAYYLASITFDIGETSEVISRMFATSGGIILFYTLGSLVSISLVSIKHFVLLSDQTLKTFNFFFLIYIVIFSFLNFETILFMLGSLRIDIYLIHESDGAYQRPGALLTMNFIILAVLYGYVAIFNARINTLGSRVFIGVIFLLYLLNSLGAMFLAQIFGSNNALVNIGGLLFAVIIFQLLLFSGKARRLLTYSKKMRVRDLLIGKIGRIIIPNVFLGTLALALVLYGAILYFDLDLTMFRIFGFGSGDTSSVSSRAKLWDNFAIHFDYSPLFGNMTVDRLTTGEGSYVHSFVGSLLTHLGLIGFVLFFAYLFLAIKEKLNSKAQSEHQKFFDNCATIFSLIIFSGVFLIATTATFITWTPLWFLMGMVFTPVTFQSMDNKFTKSLPINELA